MPQKTTSDALKSTLCYLHGGAAEDWVRVSKQKNAEQQEVREFKNEKTGAQVVVVEKGGNIYNFQRTDVTENAMDMFVVPVALSASFQKQSEPVKTPVKTKSLNADAAADKIIELLADNSDEEITEALVKKSGKALAGRFLFAIGEDEEGLFAVFAPVNDRSYDQHLSHVIEHLFSGMGESAEEMEATFSFTEYTDPVALAKALKQRGFIWEPEFQIANDAGSPIPMLPQLQGFVNEVPANLPANKAAKPIGKPKR
jgi:hypothetical protein